MNKSLYRTAFFFCFLVTISLQLKSQNNTISFYKVIEGDSVVMFFDDKSYFRELECADNKRYTLIDSAGNFFQSFVDSTNQNSILGRGYYMDGYKNGPFETYFHNGQLQSKGEYRNGFPVGVWLYYYEDGKPERTLTMTPEDTLVSEFFNSRGQHTVTNGNGYFSGPVNANENLPNKIVASGNIVNGKPDGSWISYLAGDVYCSEVFLKGQNIQGSFPNTHIEVRKKYSGISVLNNFFLFSYIDNLEKFKTSACPVFKQNKNLITQSFKTELDNFKSFANDKIRDVIQRDIDRGNFGDYQLGENRVIFGFSVNEKGVPEKFTQHTGWGDQFFYPITEALRSFARFPKRDSKIFYHIIITITGGTTYSYRTYFSESMSGL